MAKSRSPVDAQDDQNHVREDRDLVARGNVLANDGGRGLTVQNAGTFVGTYGTLVLRADGNYTYTLNNNSDLVQMLAKDQIARDVFTYRTGNGSASDTAQLVISVSGRYDAPVAHADVASVQEDGTLVARGNVLANDTSIDAGGGRGDDHDDDHGEHRGEGHRDGRHDDDHDGLHVLAPGTFAGHYGTLVLRSDGSYTYTLNNQSTAVQSLAEGQTVTDTFAYTAVGEHGVRSSSQLTVSVVGANDAPIVAAQIAAATPEDAASFVIDLLQGAHDEDAGAVLGIANVSGLVPGMTLLGHTLVVDPSDASFQHLAQGATTDITLTYDVIDEHGAEVAQSAMITITGTNDVAVAADDALIADQGKALTFSAGLLLSNDSDVDSATLTFGAIVTGPAHGTLGTNAEGSLTYTPDAGFFGADAFTYTASDGIDQSSVATAAIEVRADSDGDGVVDALEAAGPNGGDANGDGIQDLLQSNVVSVMDPVTGQNITLVSDDGTTLTNVRSTSVLPTQGADAPVGVVFPFGEFFFELHGVAPGGSAAVTFLLPPDSGVNSIYKFDPEPGNPVSHWFSFDFDSATNTGATINGDSVTLNFVDGQRGDADLSADGVITDGILQGLGGPSIAGAGALRAINDTASVQPFSTVVISNPSGSVNGLGLITVTVNFDASHGTLSNLTGGMTFQGTTNGVATYKVIATPLAATAAIDALVFDPSDNRVAAGMTETTQFTITAGNGYATSTNSNAKVTAISANDLPYVQVNPGWGANVLGDGRAQFLPLERFFGGTTIGDRDPGTTLTTTVSLEDPALGHFVVTNAVSWVNAITQYGGSVRSDGTSFTIVGSPSFVTQMLQSNAVPYFVATDGTLLPGHPADAVTHFAISVSDGFRSGSYVAPSVVDSSNTLVVAYRDVSFALGETDVPLSATGTLGVTNTGVGTQDPLLTHSYIAQTNVTGAHGHFTIDSAGKWTYAANSAFDSLKVGESVSDSFVVSGGGLSERFVTISINGTNDAPVATSVMVGTTENATLTTTMPLAASDVDGAINAAGYALVTGVGPNNGVLIFNANGTYGFNPSTDFDVLAAGASRDVSFTYTAKDNLGLVSAPQTVTIHVTGTNDAPVAVNDVDAVSEYDSRFDGWDSHPLILPNVLANDSDLESSISVVTNGQSSIQLSGTYGTYTLGRDGTLAYLPGDELHKLAQGETGTDTISFNVTDGQVSVAETVTVNFTGENSVPVAEQHFNDYVVEAGYGTAGVPVVSGNVITGPGDSDFDPDHGAVLHVLTSDTGDRVGRYGTLHLNVDGSYTYTLDNSAAAVQALQGGGLPAADWFYYSVQDEHGATSIQKGFVGPLIWGSNDAPVVVDEVQTVSEYDSRFVQHTHTQFMGPSYITNDLNLPNVLANDADPEGSTLSVVTNGLAAVFLSGIYGTYTLAFDGSLIFTGGNELYSLAQGEVGTETITFAVTDGQVSTPETLTMHFTGQNTAPVAVADANYNASGVVEAGDGTAGTPTATGNALANDRDTDHGSQLHVAAFRTGNHVGTYGTLVLESDGSYAYTLNNSAANVQALAAGQIVDDYFLSQAADEFGSPSNVAQLWVRITGSNDAPVVVDEVQTVSEYDSRFVQHTHTQFMGPSYITNDLNLPNVLANDADPEGSTLSVVTNGLAAVFLSGIYGTYTLAFDGSLIFTGGNELYSLAQGEVGTETITFAVTDGQVSTPETLTMHFTGQNTAPVAVADANYNASGVVEAGDGTAGTPTATGNALANDRDTDHGSQLHVAAFRTGNHVGTYGTLVLESDGSYAYTLNNSAANVQALAAGQIVDDYFLSQAADEFGSPSNVAQLWVRITGSNDAPVVVDNLSAQTVDAGSPLNFALTTDAFSDADTGDTLTYAATLADGSALPAWLTFDAGSLAFSGTPAQGDAGRLDLSVTATDTHGASATGNFTLDVTSAVQPNSQSVTLLEDGSANVMLTAVGIGGTPSFTVTTGPSHGTLGGSGANLVYTPAHDYSGADSISYSADDGQGGTVSGSVTLDVTAVADAPMLSVVTPSEFSAAPFTPAVSEMNSTSAGGFPTTTTTPVMLETESNDPVGTILALVHSRANDVPRSLFAIAPNTDLNSPADPTVAITGTVGTVASGADYDLYRLHLQAGETVTFDIDHAAFATNVYMYIADTTNRVLRHSSSSYPATPDPGSDITQNSMSTYNTLTTADYVVYVRGNAASASETGSYVLNVSIAPPSGPVVTDGNDTLATAKAISRADFAIAPNADLDNAGSPSVAITGSVSAAGEVDYFRFHFNAGELVTFDIDHALFDTTLTIFDASGVQVAYNDDAGLDAGSDLITNSFLPYVAGVTGDYYAKVAGWSSASGSYVLNVSIDAGLNHPAGNEDTAIGLPITAALGDTDGSEILAVRVAGLPAGSVLSSGDDNGDGSWTVSGGNLAGLTLTPPQDYNGTLHLTVTAIATEQSNHDAAVVSASLDVTVEPVNDAPVVVGDSAITNEGGAVTISVLANDHDPDAGDTLTIYSLGSAQHGTVALSGGDVIYTPGAGFYGSDSFGYTVRDASGLVASATVNVEVAPDNVPVSVDDSATTDEDSAVTINVRANDYDPDAGDVLSIAALGLPQHGSVTFDGDNVTYTPFANFNGADSFTYTVQDALGLTSTSAVFVTVNAVNDAPVLRHSLADGIAVEGQPFSYQLRQDAFSDVDNSNLLYNARLADGSPLPAWLSFDATTLTLFGTPSSDDTYPMDVRVTVSDGEAAASDVMHLAVVPAASVGPLWADDVAAAASVLRPPVAATPSSGPAIFDFNGDSWTDWIIEMPDMGGGWPTGVAVVYGQAGMADADAQALAWDTATDLAATNQGLRISADLGFAGWVTGDVNGDGRSDIAMTQNPGEAGIAPMVVAYGGAAVGDYSLLGNNYFYMPPDGAGADVFGADVFGAYPLPLGELDPTPPVWSVYADAYPNPYIAPILVHDFNGDGHGDILVYAYPNAYNDFGHYVFVDGAQTLNGFNTLDQVAILPGFDFTPTHPLSNFAQVVPDLDGDGKSDLQIGSDALLSASGRAVSELFYLYMADGYSTAHYAGDVTGDGYADYFNNLSWSNPSDTFVLTGGLDSVIGGDWAAAPGFHVPYAQDDLRNIGDLNGDGRSEILIVSQNFVLTGGFQSLAETTAGDLNGAQGFHIIGADTLFPGDLNGDGVGDIIVQGHNATGPVPNDIVFGSSVLGGVGTLGLDLPGSVRIYSTWERPFEALGDLNHDGIGDLSIDDEMFDLSASAYYVPGQDFRALGIVTGTAGNDTMTGDSHANTLAGRAGDDNLVGGDGNDTLLGGDGNDRLEGGAGADRLDGGFGADIYVYHSASEGGDTILGFWTPEGDALDIKDLLVGFSPTAPDAFVRLPESGGNTTVLVDADGAVNGENFVALATLQNVTGLLLNDLLAHYNLIVA